MNNQYDIWGDGMIHKCPVCRYHPLVELKETEWFCPDCGWESEITKMVLDK